MGRIFVEMIQDNLVVTKYESDGFVIPDNISQKKKVVALIENNLDLDKTEDFLSDDMLAVPREEFLSTLLSFGEECQEKYVTYGKGLYSITDMKRGITWAEVAYLLYYVGGVQRVLDWREIRPVSTHKVCVLHEVNDGRKILDEKLADYKSRLDMEHYIKLIVSGNRYIPLPLYCSYIDLCNNEDCNSEESGLNLDISMMFKKMSKQDMGVIFGN